MRIGRLELGFWRKEGKLVSVNYPYFEYLRGLCGCHLLSVGPLCATWLSDECYLPVDPNPPEPLSEDDNSSTTSKSA